MTRQHPTAGLDIAELVERARDGDARAFEALVNRYKDRIYSYVSRMLHDPVEAEDIAQETFVRAFQSLPHFRGASSLQTWLYRIASNLVIDSVRRQKRREDNALSLDAPVATGNWRTSDADRRSWPKARSSRKRSGAPSPASHPSCARCW